jgi:hypothetical protein
MTEVEKLKKILLPQSPRVFFSLDGTFAMNESNGHQLGVDAVAALVILASPNPAATLRIALDYCGWNEPQLEDALAAIEIDLTGETRHA